MAGTGDDLNHILHSLRLKILETSTVITQRGIWLEPGRSSAELLNGCNV